MKKLVTAESVGEGHPDSLCDQVSDAILDDLIKQDPDFTWEKLDKVDEIKALLR